MPKIPSNYHSKATRAKECQHDATERQYDDGDYYNECRLEKEYVRALNATKMDKMMSKPLVGSHMLHNEGIVKMERSRSKFITASYSNEIIVWDLVKKEALIKLEYLNQINSVGIYENKAVVTQDRSILFTEMNKTNSNDYQSNLYNISTEVLEKPRFEFSKKVTNKFSSKIDQKQTVNHVDIGESKMAVGTTHSSIVCDLIKGINLYEKPGQCNQIQFNHSIGGILGIVGDGAVRIEDTRANSTVYSGKMPVNCIKFNNNKLICGGDKLTVFDMREMGRALREFKTSGPILSVDSTGTRTSCGTADCVIFNFVDEKLADVYYNQRMGLIHGLRYSGCGNYLVSGSDDGSVRVWKADANQRTLKTGRERRSSDGNRALQEKYGSVAEIARIRRHKFTPKEIKRKMNSK
ncbi:DCA13 [Enterospora canceri]|uniref:DCA13 n=1 Tax=Enterospora canceri TaxID=1081671 RepID=A0A1Y1S6G4_9MICR|nr:DCA13 [Enterospora canceri]